MLLLILNRRSDQCKKAVIVMKDPEQNVTEEDSDYDYDDVSATSDENHDEDDDSNDAFQEGLTILRQKNSIKYVLSRKEIPKFANL